ncbi:hypothetical protein CXK86_20475 [Paenibacillus sp. BGI2013]|uniref:hypothetical protein n=1 Tax=Paenibacillus sp. BGI2013 TaxID=2058902 RepID=UPI000C6D1DF9|nr:hypothetical protein [Paenibacillus sp. BGI2013]PKQ89424.1 hypothetical protein CXK86_20475 [Paenibacillus sp. BGI2013]
MLTKKDLLKQWLVNHELCSFTAGKVNAVRAVSQTIEQLLLIEGRFKVSIYILYKVSEVEGNVPVYVGRSKNPLIQGKAHLKGLMMDWRFARTVAILLLDDADKFIYDFAYLLLQIPLLTH